MQRARGIVSVLQRASVAKFGGAAAARVATTPLISQTRMLGSARIQKDKIPIYFQNSAGEQKLCHARLGETLLEVAIDNDIDLEGACGGTLACSTCHVYIDENLLDTFPEMEEEEEDMLDLAVAVKDNSRLGCQCCVGNAHKDMVVTLADEYADAR
eukprot:m.443048 g.443048  ORF g.443048 m.443048 type:complete len:156 (-) comp18905_c0_seq1:59-526(-)